MAQKLRVYLPTVYPRMKKLRTITWRVEEETNKEKHEQICHTIPSCRLLKMNTYFYYLTALLFLCILNICIYTYDFAILRISVCHRIVINFKVYC